MNRIHWTPQAADDLAGIHDYIGRDSPSAAQAVVVRLFTAIEMLEQFPRSGRVVPEFGRPDLRELVRGQYRIVYRLVEADVQLIRIHHSARPLGPDSATDAS